MQQWGAVVQHHIFIGRPTSTEAHSITFPAGIGQKGACIHKARRSRRITHNLSYAAQAVHLVFGVPRLCTCVRASLICVLRVWNGAWFMCAIWREAGETTPCCVPGGIPSHTSVSFFDPQVLLMGNHSPSSGQRRSPCRPPVLIMRASTHAHGV